MNTERFYKENEFKNYFEEKITELRHQYPSHEHEILSQLAALLYPKLFAASVGDFEDDFDIKQYGEEPEQPEYESAAEELGRRAKIYSLRKGVDYLVAQAAILEVDPDLAERYKLE